MCEQNNLFPFSLSNAETRRQAFFKLMFSQLSCFFRIK